MNDLQNAIYLTPQENSTWSASASDSPPHASAIKLADEKNYPVDIFYYRTDLNGSGCYEGDTCQNQKDLLDALNWYGECRYTILKFWDFDYENSTDEKLIDLFNDAARKRRELIMSEMDAFFPDDDMDETEEIAALSLDAMIEKASERAGGTSQGNFQIEDKLPF